MSTTNELIKELVDQRQKIWNHLQEMNDRAKTDKRQFDAVERQEWDQGVAELGQYKTRIEELYERDKRNEELAEQREALGTILHDTRPKEPTMSADERELRTFLTPGSAKRSFEVNFRGLEKHSDSRNGAWEVRDNRNTLVEGLNQAGTTTGGFLVPRDFRRQLFEHLLFNSAIRQTNVEVITTDNGDALIMPKTASHPLGAAVGEGTAIGGTDPAFGQGTLLAYKYGALIQVSRELLDDSGVDLVGYLARRTGEALGNLSGSLFVVGSGTNQPQGFLPLIAVGVTGGTGVSGAATYANLVSLYYSVIAPYRNRGYWFASDTAMASIAGLTTTTGQPIFTVSLQAGVPDQLLGRPIVTDPSMPAKGTSGTSIAFGDFSNYFIRDVGGVRFERSDEYAFNTDLVTFRALIRTDGDLMGGTTTIQAFVGGTA